MKRRAEGNRRDIRGFSLDDDGIGRGIAGISANSLGGCHLGTGRERARQSYVLLWAGSGGQSHLDPVGEDPHLCPSKLGLDLDTRAANRKWTFNAGR